MCLEIQTINQKLNWFIWFSHSCDDFLSAAVAAAWRDWLGSIQMTRMTWDIDHIHVLTPDTALSTLYATAWDQHYRAICDYK